MGSTARGRQRLSPTPLDRFSLDTLLAVLSPLPPSLEDSGCLVCLLPMPTTTLLFTARGKQSPSSSSLTTLVLLPRPTQSTLLLPPLPVSLTLQMLDLAPTLSELLFLARQK